MSLFDLGGFIIGGLGILDAVQSQRARLHHIAIVLTGVLFILGDRAVLA